MKRKKSLPIGDLFVFVSRQSPWRITKSMMMTSVTDDGHGENAVSGIRVWANGVSLATVFPSGVCSTNAETEMMTTRSMMMKTTTRRTRTKIDDRDVVDEV
jgi:hypothetical protein